MTRFRKLAPGAIHFAWWVVFAAFVSMLASSGIRSAFGVFLKPIEGEFASDRTGVSVVAMISVLVVGLVQPIVGQLVDRFGTRWMIVISMLIAGLGTVATAFAQQLWHIYIVYGVIVSIALGGTNSVTASSIAARWFQSRRGLAIGITMAGTSAGQLLLIPVAMYLTEAIGWRATYAVFGAALALLICPLALLVIRSDPKDVGLRPYGASSDVTTAANIADERRTTVGQAFRSRDFWLLSGAYWTCGYTTAGLTATHLVAHTLEHGFTAVAAASALGVMGAMNIIGTIGAGWVADRFGKKVPLAAYYGVRGLMFIFLIWVTSRPEPSIFLLSVFSVVFGLTFIATVPPTAAMTASLFGKRSVGSILGWVFLIHQTGGAIGAIVGGMIHDATGGYELAFASAAIVCFVASMAIYAIDETPYPRTRIAPAASQA